MSAQIEFVKAATTTTPVSKTQSDIMAMLGRYGASGFGFRTRGTIVEVTFHLPRTAGDDHTVRIPIDTAVVLTRLNAPQYQRARKAQKQAREVATDQAERVAWRILLLWIDAALSAVSLGAQSIEEAFFAHLVVRTDDGQEGRLVDYVGTLVASSGALPNPSRLLLRNPEAP